MKIKALLGIALSLAVVLSNSGILSAETEAEIEDRPAIVAAENGRNSSNLAPPGGSDNSRFLLSATSKTCKAGYKLNKKTNRCNKIKCKTGYALGDDNKCHKIVQPKTCKSGYYLNTATNRCNKIKEVKQKTCKSGYVLNTKTNRCNKIKTCKDDYWYNAATNTCHKITCPFGYEYRKATGLCWHRICPSGKIISEKTGKCIVNRNGKYKECSQGYALDVYDLKCKKIVTKQLKNCSSGSYYNLETKECVATTATTDYRIPTRLILFASAEEETEPTEESFSPALSPSIEDPEGVEDSDEPEEYEPEIDEVIVDELDYLEPIAAVLSDIDVYESDELDESISDDPVEESDPEEEPTPTKTCPEGYYLKESTNRCNKIKEPEPCPEGKYRNPETNRCKKIETEEETEESTGTKTCPEGSELNPDTNRCKKIAAEAEPKTCPEGKYLNPETNRCKTIEEPEQTKTCPEGKYLNPETNRCKTIEAEKTEKTCPEGSELNPETNRCRKVKKNTGDQYPVEVPALGETKQNFIAGSTIIFIICAAALYLGYTFRKQLKNLARRVLTKVKGHKKD